MEGYEQGGEDTTYKGFSLFILLNSLASLKPIQIFLISNRFPKHIPKQLDIDIIMPAGPDETDNHPVGAGTEQ